jgi:hypothetical protein
MRKRKERVSEEKRLLFFWAFFSRRDCFSDREEQTEERTNFLQNEELFCFGSRRAATTRKMQKEEFTTRTTREQRENIY